MKQKTPGEILHGIEYFGYPVRNWYLEDSGKLVEQGLLTQQQIDESWKKGQDRIDAEKITRYGTSNPTAKQMFEKGSKLLEKGRKVLENIENPGGFVGMWEGKYSNGEELYTSGLGGCIATLLYFEKKDERGGILTHYPSISLTENFDKLKELRDNNMNFKPDFQKGVILTGEGEKYMRMLRGWVKIFPPGINIELLVYNQNQIGEVILNPAEGHWDSEQFGKRSFK